ncbi:hypothetical protein PYTT13_10470 [Paracoccus yeei]|uniref:Uncharacterized protein n=1 Tax=Paracoccus yeei TaxID=147645 RepID=A0A2D2C1A9_9RHOB|nr:hypothetical protein PYTT13_10470 [Paracoccus yeei]
MWGDDMKHDLSRQHRNQRERQTRREQRRQDRHIANADLRNTVRAIGAGEIEHWQHEGDEDGE